MISINIIATNKYLEFLPDLIESIDRFFIKKDRVNVIIHTNLEIGNLSSDNGRISVTKNQITHEAWPFTTLKRFHYFLSVEEIIMKSDYSFYIDADSLFIGDIDTDILPRGGMIGTIHPCLFNSCGTPERNPESTAFIHPNEKNRYFCGGFFGGDSLSFMNMSKIISNNIDIDLKNNIIAIWHDESHINRFFLDNTPSSILEPPFAVAESLTEMREESKILFLDKNLRGGHNNFR
jgi:histo-blood group ABO system transferase